MPQTTCNDCGKQVHISDKNRDEGAEVYCSPECSENRSKPLVRVMNCYAVQGYKDIHDKFPVNTYIGSDDDVIDCLRKLLRNRGAGIARVEIVIDPHHPNATIGQNPQQL